MSNLLNIQSDSALVAGISTVIGAGIAFNAYKFVKKIIDNTPPQKWRKVGELSDLWVYPVKSCGPIVLNDIDCGVIGAGRGYLRDRVFMVTRLCGETVTARTYPKMVRIIPKIEKNILTVSASGMPDLVVDIEKLYSLSETIFVKIWKDTTECIDCGDEAAKWFSKAILGEDKGFRFAFYASSDPKQVIADRGYLYEQADDIDTGALHDEASYLLMNQGSFDDLNSRIDKKVGALQYRPNFLIKGPSAWEEDKWKWVKIGSEAIFKSNQPCTRCVLTNIDPATGERNPQMEPLKTLKTFRLFEEVATSPVFGLHLGIRQNGRVRVGDAVYVGE